MSDGRLYLVNGDSAAGVLEAAGLAEADDILVLHDVLSCGSLAGAPPGGERQNEPSDFYGARRGAHPNEGLVDWLPAREDFWSRVWDSAERFGYVHEPFTGFEHKSRNVYAAGPRLRAAADIVLCTGAGLSDVLAQGFFIAWAGSLGIDPGHLYEVQLAGPETPPVGLPHLAPPGLAAAWRVEALTPVRRAAALTFWQSFVAAQAVGARPPVAAERAQSMALAAWRSRHPTEGRTLAAWDERLLGLAVEGATLKSVLGATLRSAWDDPDPVGDLVLLHRLNLLAADGPGPALLELGPVQGLDTPCVTTGAGRAALDGWGDDAAAERLGAWRRSLA